MLLLGQRWGWWLHWVLSNYAYPPFFHVHAIAKPYNLLSVSGGQESSIKTLELPDQKSLESITPEPKFSNMAIDVPIVRKAVAFAADDRNSKQTCHGKNKVFIFH
ncbi:hypothetical protein ACLOJK_035415 [Asimina triloba]